MLLMMATYIEKLEDELVSLMGETGRQTLKASLRRAGAQGETFAFFDKVALVKSLTETFSMFMPENRLGVFKIKLINIKGDDEQ